MKAEEPEVEYRFSLADGWSRRVFVALLRRYGLKPYRYPRQKRNTVMSRGPRRFFDETLWPEYSKIAATLQRYLEEVTDRVIAEAVHADRSDAVVVAEPGKLAAGTE